jgi:hypothetical protein
MGKMKILFICDDSVDYLSDLILIGLVNNGHEVVDTKYRYYLGPIKDEERAQHYGKAFTISNNLSDDRKFIDRTNVKEKIISKFFDIIIYANPFRCTDYLDTVTDVYKKNEIVFLDGEDGNQIEQYYAERGIYFKREKISHFESSYPISFSIPKKKIWLPKGIVQKERFYSHVNPTDKSTYIYDNEDDYYNDYRKSVFGFTMPKGGWDCLRHYEIIANYCLPYFNVYDTKPQYTMTNWPSDLQAEANYLYHTFDGKSYERISKLTQEFTKYALENLTSEKVAEKMLEKL